MKPLVPPAIKSPCPKLWREMRGDLKKRFCDHCNLHVQNLSAMSRREVAAVLARSNTEHVCVTYTKRSDDTMVTRWQTIYDHLLTPVRRGFAWAVAACIPIVFSACQTQSPVLGRAGPGCNSQQQKKTAQENERVIVTGGI